VVGDVLRAQVLLLLLLAGCALVAAAHARWPGPGRAAARRIDRLLVGWEPRHVVGTVLVGCAVFVVTALCVSPR
jgi:hypothetical protein